MTSYRYKFMNINRNKWKKKIWILILAAAFFYCDEDYFKFGLPVAAPLDFAAMVADCWDNKINIEFLSAFLFLRFNYRDFHYPTVSKCLFGTIC